MPVKAQIVWRGTGKAGLSEHARYVEHTGAASTGGKNSVIGGVKGC
jgi:hypothetical protein